MIPELISQLANYPIEELERIGDAGRQYALSHLVDKVCLPKVTEILTMMTDQ